MPNLEGKRLQDARPGSPAATRNAAFDRMSHAESVAAYYRNRGDEESAGIFDRQAASGGGGVSALTVRLSDDEDGYEVLSDDGLEAFVSIRELTTAENPERLMSETIERVGRVVRVRRFVRLLEGSEVEGS
jgi:hypothetical protein